MVDCSEDNLQQLAIRQYVDTGHGVVSETLSDHEQEVPVGAYIEIRAQAVSNEAYRERIRDIDIALKEQFQSILQRGIDQDLVWDIDVDQISEYLVTTIIGAIERYATTETVSVDRVQAEIEQYLDQRVIA